MSNPKTDKKGGPIGVLPGEVALLGGKAEVAEAFARVRGMPAAKLEAATEPILTRRIPAIRGFLVVRDGTNEVLVDAPAALEAAAEVGKRETGFAMAGGLRASGPKWIVVLAEEFLRNVPSAAGKGGKQDEDPAHQALKETRFAGL